MRRPSVLAYGLAVVALGCAAIQSAAARNAKMHGEDLELAHSEDFTRASSYDADFWEAESGMFRNGEAQHYSPANVEVRDGALSLVARKETTANGAYKADSAEWPGNVRFAQYTSGSIVSRSAFRFGAFEVVARLPQGPGAWPAIWTIFEQGLPYREIDLVEAVGATPGIAFSTVSAGPDAGHLQNWKGQTKLPDIDTAYHAYRLDWSPARIVISIDGHEALRMNPDDARKDGIDPLRMEMRLRINFALGGSWGGRIDDGALPARLDVKSIRIWRLREAHAVSGNH